MLIDEIYDEIGHFSVYQKRILWVISLINVLAGMQVALPVIVASSPAVFCSKLGEQNSSITCERLSFEHAYCDIEQEYWEMEQSDRTFVSSWNLFCTEHWKVGFITSMYFVGNMLGNGYFGALADRIGRKTSFYIGVFIFFVACMGSALAPSYWLYVLARSLVGVGHGASLIVGFVLMTETVGKTWRSFCGSFTCACFSVGIMIMAVVASYHQHWRSLTLLIASPTIIIFFFWPQVIESPFWAASKGDIPLATRLVQSIANVNNSEFSVPTVTVARTTSDANNAQVKTSDLILHAVLRPRTFAMLVIWFGVAFSYYGLSFNAGNMGGDVYTNLFLMAFSELPSYPPVQYALERAGRRCTLFTTLWIASVFYALCLAVTVPAECEVNDASCTQKSVRLVLSLLGKCSVTGSFTIVFIYSAELFPTAIRSAAVGLFSQSARVGSMIAPMVVSLGEKNRSLPFFIFGCSTVLAALASHTLPETLGTELVESLEELEKNQNYDRLSDRERLKDIDEEESDKENSEVESAILEPDKHHEHYP